MEPPSLVPCAYAASGGLCCQDVSTKKQCEYWYTLRLRSMIRPFTVSFQGLVGFLDPFQAPSMKEIFLPMCHAWVLCIRHGWKLTSDVFGTRWTTAIALMCDFEKEGKITVLHSVSCGRRHVLDFCILHSEEMIKVLLSRQGSRVCKKSPKFEHYKLWIGCRDDLEYRPMLDICNAFGLFCKMCMWGDSWAWDALGDCEKVIEYLRTSSCSSSGLEKVEYLLAVTENITPLAFSVLCAVAEAQWKSADLFSYGISGVVAKITEILCDSEKLSPLHQQSLYGAFNVRFVPASRKGGTYIILEDQTLGQGVKDSGEGARESCCLYSCLMMENYGVVDVDTGHPFQPKKEEDTADDLLGLDFLDPRPTKSARRSERARRERGRNLFSLSYFGWN